jgi:ubiquinone/menaquinone biosynthesis C-methylase UbiE
VTVVTPSHEPEHAMARDVALHRAIIGEFGHRLDKGSLVLDFGCGDEGEMVMAYRQAGLQAFGADLRIVRASEWLRVIPGDSYRLPFPDATFDFLYSNSVLEHVGDLDLALAEMHRVLKPSGVALHLFPPPGRPIEAHVFVPFGGIFRGRLWLLLWALAGVRNSFQRNVGIRERARRNYAYLHEKTFYRTKRELERRFRRYFRRVTFADRQMIRHSYGKAKYLSPYAERVGFIARCYGSLHQRCLFCEK